MVLHVYKFSALMGKNLFRVFVGKKIGKHPFVAVGSVHVASLEAALGLRLSLLLGRRSLSNICGSAHIPSLVSR